LDRDTVPAAVSHQSDAGAASAAEQDGGRWRTKRVQRSRIVSKIQSSDRQGAVSGPQNPVAALQIVSILELSACRHSWRRACLRASLSYAALTSALTLSRSAFMYPRVYELFAAG